MTNRLIYATASSVKQQQNISFRNLLCGCGMRADNPFPCLHLLHGGGGGRFFLTVLLPLEIEMGAVGWLKREEAFSVHN
jgi:hypothetical protein